MSNLVIRLRRRNRERYQTYDIVLVSPKKRDRSAFKEKLGFYNPIKRVQCKINTQRLGF